MQDDKKWLDLLDAKLKQSGAIARSMFRSLSESEGLLSLFIRKLSELNKYELGQLAINKIMTQSARSAVDTLESWLLELGNIAKEGLNKAITLAVESSEIVTKATNEMLVLGYTLADISKLMINKTRDLIMAQVRTAARSNTIQDLNKYFFGTRAKGNKDGLLYKIKRSFIYHTSNATAAAFNWGNELKWSLKGIKFVRLVATIDNKTSDYCESIHLKTFPIFQGARPPFHPHCRTIVVPA